MKVVVLFLLFNFIIYAKHIPFVNYNAKDGLFQATAYYLYQDHDGFIWIATQSGVFKFDGIIFQNFSIDEGLINNRVYTICEDSSDNFLYFGTEGGLSIFHENRFKNYNKKNSSLEINTINSLFYDKKNNRVFCGTNKGLYIIKDTIFQKSLFVKDGLLNDTILNITSDTLNKIYLSYPNGIGIIDDTNIINYPLNNISINGTYISKENEIYIYTKKGIFYFKNNKLYPFYPKFFANISIKTMLIDNFGGFWIGPENAYGLYNISHGLVYVYKTENGFTTLPVYHVFQDKDDNLWFCTNGGYVYKLTDRKFSYYNEIDGLDSRAVWSIEKFNDKLLIGTERGLNIFDNGKIYKDELCKAIKGGPYPILSIFNDKKTKKIYIAQWGRGLWIYDVRKRNIINFNAENSPLSNFVRELYKDNYNNLWILSKEGLFLYKNEQFIRYDHNNGLWNDNVYTLHQLPDGEYIIGTINGLIRLKNGLFYQTTIDNAFENIIILDFLYKDSTLWIATGNGLYQMDKNATKILTHLTGKEGLSDKMCYFLLKDDRNRLWTGTNRGLNVYDGKNITVYSESDGLPGSEFNQHACFKTNSGILYFGNIKGLVEYNPEFDYPKYITPKVYIKKFAVFDSLYPVNKKLKLKYNQNFIFIEYIGLDFSHPDKVKYKIRLKGLSDEFRITKERKVQFAYLPYGSYIFEVYAISSSGVESKQPATIYFEITPPFWKTPLFYFFAGFFVVGLVIIWMWRLKVQAKRLEILVEERTKQLHQKNLALIEEKNRLEKAKNQLSNLNRQLDEASRIDPLTGLSNRRDLMEKLEYEAKRAVRLKIPLSFVMGDIDHFKKINDTYGHKAGDFILIEIAKIFRKNLRETDIICRWGGEEFLFVLPNTDLNGAKIVAEKIRKIIENHIFNFNGIIIKVTISFGVSTFHETRSIDDFIKFADNSLYKAKKLGRNKVIVYEQ